MGNYDAYDYIFTPVSVKYTPLEMLNAGITRI